MRHLLRKKNERQGPKIAKKERRDSLGFFFEILRFNQEPQRPQEFDIEPEEEERLS